MRHPRQAPTRSDWGGQSRRASGTVCARLAVIATRKWYMVLPCCAAPAGAAREGECRAQTALNVPVSHECDAPAEWHMVWPCYAALRQRGWGHVQSAGRGRGGRTRQVRRRMCRSRRDGDALVAAHACAARCCPPAGCGRGGRSRRARGTGRAGLTAMAARRWRHTRVWPGSGPPSAVAGEGGRVTRDARGVQVLQRL